MEQLFVSQFSNPTKKFEGIDQELDSGYHNMSISIYFDMSIGDTITRSEAGDPRTLEAS